MAKTKTVTIATPTVSAVLMESFEQYSTQAERIAVAQALPKVFAQAAATATDNSEIEIRVGKTLSAGTRRVAIRVFTAGQSKPVFSTSPAVLLGHRKPRTTSGN